MTVHTLTHAQYEFKDMLEHQLMSSGLDVTKVKLSKTYDREEELIGAIYFSKERVDFELNQLFQEYHTKKNAINDFVFYLMDWKRNGEKIRAISEIIFNQNNIEAQFVLRSFGGFSYNASSKTIFSCPKTIMSERPRFIKAEHVNDYIASCLLHETGHHIQSLKTNLIEERLELLRLVEEEKITKSDFYYRYIDATLTIEIDAWKRSETLIPPFPINQEFFNKLKVHSLSTYRENLPVEAGIYYQLFLPIDYDDDMMIS